MIYSLLFSVVIAFFLAIILSSGFKRRGPGPMGGLFFMSLIIFMFSWIIGSWMVPIGPLTWGISWMGYLLIAVLIMFLLGALLPGPEAEKQLIDKEELDKEVIRKRTIKSMDRAAGLFFWILIITFLIVAFFQLYYPV